MQGNQMRRIRCVIMRGGTSKGVFVNEVDLPTDADMRSAAILGLMGTPDARQIDGLGGSDALTSKFAIIGPSSRPDADVDYTFVQVGVDEPTLDYLGACGNISAAVGPYAIQEGLVRPTGDLTRVRIHQVNTHKVLVAEVRTAGGDPEVVGDTAIDGVPGTGAAVWMDFAGTLGAGSGRLLPTGSARDVFDVPGLGAIEVSLVDAANPYVYVRAQDLGLTGTELPDDYGRRPDVTEWLEHIRGQAAVAVGWTTDPLRARHECSLHPLVTVIHPPTAYRAYGSGEQVQAEQMDIVVRMQVLQRLHKAYSGTGTANFGIAAVVPGSIVHEMLGEPEPGTHRFRLGHPSGVIVAEAEVVEEDGQLQARRLAFERTARRIMDGYAYVREDRLTRRDAIVSAGGATGRG